MGNDPQIVSGKKHGLPEILAFSPAAHNQVFRSVSAQLQTVPGGHSGLELAVASGIVTHMASSAAARSNSIFFTVKLLVEVEVAP